MAESANNLNLAIPGSSIIFTPPFTGVVFVPQCIIVRCISVEGLISPSSISVGTNLQNYNDIIPITSLSGLASVNSIIVIPITIGVAIPKGTEIRVNVVNPIVGVSQYAEVYINGFYG